MLKRVIIPLMILTVVLSGAAGFGGTYLAKTLINEPSVTQEDTASNQRRSDPALDADYLNAYIDGYLATVNTPDDSSAWNSEQIGEYIDSYLASQDSPTDDSGYITLFSNSGDTQSSRELSIPEIAGLASSSVVEIYTETVVNSGRMGQFVNEGAGSGVIISKDGYIVTNNHVIEGSRRITVRLNNGTDYEATLIGRDSRTDLAVIKIDATGLQPAVYGDSDRLMVGELAVAIGNPLGKLGGTVTEGIISALGRNIEIDGHTMTLLQTSAAVNPGNSGGGLFNSYGELIGIVNSKSSGTDIEGLGFAIPVNLARNIAESLIEFGFVPGRVDFGAVLLNVLDPWTAMMYRVQTTGVYVSQIDADSPLRVGDRIISIDGIAIDSIADVSGLIETKDVGDVLNISVSRNGSTMTVMLTLKQEINM